MSGSNDQDLAEGVSPGGGAIDSPPSDSRRSSSGGVPALPPIADLPSDAGRTDRPTDLPDFRLLAKIGQGGFGSVWIAQHRHTGDAVAIKFIPPNSRDIELQGLQQLRQKVREGQDHLVWTEYIGESEGFIYCVMDLADPVVEGPLFADRYEALTLLKHLKQKGRLDVLEAAGVTLAIAKGLSFLQGAGLRHGDIKPANILRVRGKWKLADYGMMGGLDVRARGGTRSYLPPEGPHGDRADQYALGIVLHELVFGHRPTDSTRETWPESRISTGLRRIQQRLTEPDPNRRYASAGELVKELEGLTSTASPVTTGAAGACPSCGEAIFGSEVACGNCGSELWRQCPICQHRGSIVQRYCTQCRGPVHGIFAMRKELNEADALLCDGHHRECLQRIEGPLQDLLLEVARDLSKLHGGDLSRRRRVEGIEAEFSSRLARMRERSGLLREVDSRIAQAHERGDVASLRDSIARALEIVPGASTYEALRSDLPVLEARSRWTALLGRLGNPHQDLGAIDSESLQIAIGTLRQHLPEHPSVRQEAKQVIAALQDEQRRRVRDRCAALAAWHRREGRPLEALRWLRRAESRQTADRAMSAEIAELAAELKPMATSLRTEATAQLQQVGGHRRLRRLESSLGAIEGGASPIVKKLRSEWPRRRRIDLLRRISERAIRRISAGDFLGTDPLLALAFRIADRDPAVRDRVIDLDNSISARIRTARALLESADVARASGNVEDALQYLEQAQSIAPNWDEVLVRLGSVRSAASALPIRRRRRRIVVMAMIAMALVVAGIVAQHVWHLAPLDDLVSRLDSPSRPISSKARVEAASLLGDPSRSTDLLLTDLKLYAALQESWTRSWERDYGTEGPLAYDEAIAAAEELSKWRRTSGVPGVGASVADPVWIDSATRRLISRVIAPPSTRLGRVKAWRNGAEVAARLGGGFEVFLETAGLEIGNDLQSLDLQGLKEFLETDGGEIEVEPQGGAAGQPTAALLDEYLAFAAVLEAHPETRPLGASMREAVTNWCEKSVDAMRTAIAQLVERATTRGPRSVEMESLARAFEAWKACGESQSEFMMIHSRLSEQVRWPAVSISFDGSEPRVLGETSLDQPGPADRLRLLPIVVSTARGQELLLVADRLLPIEAAERILGAPSDAAWRGHWALPIELAESVCRNWPRFTYLESSWQATIPDSDQWDAVLRLHRQFDAATGDPVTALRYDEASNEWLASEGEGENRKVEATHVEQGKQPTTPDGGQLTGLRVFFTPVRSAREASRAPDGHGSSGRVSSAATPRDALP